MRRAAGRRAQQAGARIGGGTAPFDVRVATFDEVSPLLTDWERWAFTVRLTGGRRRDLQRASPAGATVPGAHAVIVARSPDGIPGRTFEMLVAGDSRKAACAAAQTVAADPTAIAHTYAVALDADGAVPGGGGAP